MVAALGLALAHHDVLERERIERRPREHQVEIFLAEGRGDADRVGLGAEGHGTAGHDVVLLTGEGEQRRHVEGGAHVHQVVVPRLLDGGDHPELLVAVEDTLGVHRTGHHVVGDRGEGVAVGDRGAYTTALRALGARRTGLGGGDEGEVESESGKYNKNRTHRYSVKRVGKAWVKLV